VDDARRRKHAQRAGDRGTAICGVAPRITASPHTTSAGRCLATAPHRGAAERRTALAGASRRSAEPIGATTVDGGCRRVTALALAAAPSRSCRLHRTRFRAHTHTPDYTSSWLSARSLCIRPRCELAAFVSLFCVCVSLSFSLFLSLSVFRYRALSSFPPAHSSCMLWNARCAGRVDLARNLQVLLNHHALDRC
jgi:hypothetical protein